MNAEVKALWVKTLRENEYPQIRGTLCNNAGAGGTGYCVMGILELLYHKSQGRYQFGWERGMSREALKWAGLSKEDPKVRYNGKYVSLWDLNDKHYLSFPKLADIIESSSSL